MTPEHARSIARRRLTEARSTKARITAGRAFEWEGRRLESLVREARKYQRLARELTPPPACVAVERPPPRPPSGDYARLLEKQRNRQRAYLKARADKAKAHDASVDAPLAG
jgi:hypothetical protein